METIYEWLLHNVGNEGNYFTILNAQRQADKAGVSGIDVMARTKDFKVLNLLVRPVETNKNPVSLPMDTADIPAPGTYFFETDQAVIACLATGSISGTKAAVTVIQIIILAPTDETGEIVFPPKQ